MIIAAFCSAISRDASAMKRSGFCLNWSKTRRLMPARMAAAVRRVSSVFAAILPSRSYFASEVTPSA